MKRSFSRTVDLSSPLTPSNGGSGAMTRASDGAIGAPIKGTGGSAEVAALATYAVTSGVMYYGVLLAIKGSVMLGGAAFIGGPLAISLLAQAAAGV